jgi:NADH-quinone oxidoreductase subunit M
MSVLVHPLFLVTFFPMLGLLVIAFLKEQQRTAIRWVALVTTLIDFGLSLWVLAQFNGANPGIQLDLDLVWLKIAGLEIHFHFGVDGLSILMLLLTTFLTPIAILSTWSGVKERVKGFMLFFMLLETAMTGVFLSLDLVLFYTFWEFTLIPMYFLIGMWGGERRIYAAVKFILYTMAGSLIMLLAILYIGFQAGSFSLPDLAAHRSAFAAAQTWLFLAFALAFAIKVPMWPLHSWLPDAHVEAPTAGSVILAGVLLKMGAYGFLRFNLPLFPQATLQFAPWMGLLAVIGILYGAIVAVGQQDLKKLVAYSSVSHLGFVMLGIFALNLQGLAGGVLQMVNHGLSTGALFLIVGMLYDRRHTHLFTAFSGLWKIMPVMGGLALVVTLSSMGLPGLNGFVGEFTILLGAFGSQTTWGPWLALAGTLGVILAAIYLLTMYEKVFLGRAMQEENSQLKDITTTEILTLVPILILIFWIGLYPKPFFDLINPTVGQLSAMLQSAAVALH